MANAANKKLLGSKGGTDVYYAENWKKFIIREEDPSHPGHAVYKMRTDAEHPGNLALEQTLVENGWPTSEPMAIWKDGTDLVVCKGRRRFTVLRRLNAARAKKRRPPILPAVVLSKTPVLTDAISNSNQMEDPPLARGYRFTLMKASIGESAAAAAEGLKISDAHLLEKILGCPVPDLHNAVNRLQVAVDVAARAIDTGSAAVQKLLDQCKRANGSLDAKAVKNAVQAEHKVRLKAVDRPTGEALAERAKAETWTGERVAKLLRYNLGYRGAIKGDEFLEKFVADAEASVRAARKKEKNGTGPQVSDSPMGQQP